MRLCVRLKCSVFSRSLCNSPENCAIMVPAVKTSHQTWGYCLFSVVPCSLIDRFLWNVCTHVQDSFVVMTVIVISSVPWKPQVSYVKAHKYDNQWVKSAHISVVTEMLFLHHQLQTFNYHLHLFSVCPAFSHFAFCWSIFCSQKLLPQLM